MRSTTLQNGIVGTDLEKLQLGPGMSLAILWKGCFLPNFVSSTSSGLPGPLTLEHQSEFPRTLKAKHQTLHTIASLHHLIFLPDPNQVSSKFHPSRPRPRARYRPQRRTRNQHPFSAFRTSYARKYCRTLLLLPQNFHVHRIHFVRPPCPTF